MRSSTLTAPYFIDAEVFVAVGVMGLRLAVLSSFLDWLVQILFTTASEPPHAGHRGTPSTSSFASFIQPASEALAQYGHSQ